MNTYSYAGVQSWGPSPRSCIYTLTGIERPPPILIDLLVQSNLYDMVFTVILKFYSGSALKRNAVQGEMYGKYPHGLLLPSKDKVASAAQHSKRKDQLDALKQYIVQTLLCADNLIQLPLWLVEMFKTTQDTSGMAARVLNQPSHHCSNCMLIIWARYEEATNLLASFILKLLHHCFILLQYLQGPAGHKVAQCEEQKSVLKAALRKYFRQPSTTWNVFDIEQSIPILSPSLTEEAAAEVLGLTTAHAIWTALETAYSNLLLKGSILLRDSLRKLSKRPTPRGYLVDAFSSVTVIINWLLLTSCCATFSRWATHIRSPVALNLGHRYKALSSSPCGLCPYPTTAAEPIQEPDSTPSSPYSSEDEQPTNRQ
ncbi:hypothetical protein Tco_0426059 [Tanacetum coccineum]